MRFIWMPLAKLQEGLGGQGQAIAMAVAVGLTLFISVMFFVPYPLKMDSEGKLIPQVRKQVYYGGMNGTILRFNVKPNENVKEKQQLIALRDITLAKQLHEWKTKRDEALRNADAAGQLANTTPDPEKRKQLIGDRDKYMAEAASLDRQLERFKDLVGARAGGPDDDWLFVVKAPDLTDKDQQALKGLDEAPLYTILNTSFEEELTGRAIRPSDPVLRLGVKNGPWEVEMKIPQKHIGQVLLAFKRLNTDELDVDFLLRSDPTRVFRGKLHRSKVGLEANPPHDEGSMSSKDEAEPVVMCYVRIAGSDIPEDKQVPRELLLSGTEVHAKVLCGDRAMGYSLFYGVWEFLFEKVVFFF
jgi:hypothetical protein